MFLGRNNTSVWNKGDSVISFPWQEVLLISNKARLRWDCPICASNHNNQSRNSAVVIQPLLLDRYRRPAATKLRLPKNWGFRLLPITRCGRRSVLVALAHARKVALYFLFFLPGRGFRPIVVTGGNLWNRSYSSALNTSHDCTDVYAVLSPGALDE